MAQTIFICVLAVIMAEVYVRTRHPKIYALLNSAAGIAGMILLRYFTAGIWEITPYNSALSAVLGIPGALLFYISGLGG